MTTKPSNPAHKSGQRTTITDVARVAGVSRTTVSYVLSGRAEARVPEKTRRRIEDAAKTVGYRTNALAIALRSGRINTIGIVSPVSELASAATTSNSVYYKDLVLAIAAAGFEAGLNTLLLPESKSENISIAGITDRRVDGVILVVKNEADTFVREAIAARVPCVTVGREYGAWQVHTDSALGGKLAVEHLLALGHRRFAYLWHGKEFIYSARVRRDSFLETLQGAGITVGTESIYTDTQVVALKKALKAKDGPTAVVCYNDELALSLIDFCRDAGLRVPEDISVVGFDDNVLAICARPRLTTIQSPLKALGAKAIEMFEAQMRGEEAPEGPILIAPTLVVRESTAAPRP